MRTPHTPRPFLVLVGSDGRLAVRVGRDLLRANEVVVTAAPVYVSAIRGRTEIRGEGVVEQDGTTVRIRP